MRQALRHKVRWYQHCIGLLLKTLRLCVGKRVSERHDAFVNYDINAMLSCLYILPANEITFF